MSQGGVPRFVTSSVATRAKFGNGVCLDNGKTIIQLGCRLSTSLLLPFRRLFKLFAPSIMMKPVYFKKVSAHVPRANHNAAMMIQH